MERTAATSRGPLAEIHGFRGTVLSVFPGAMYIAGATAESDLLVVHDASHGHTPTSLLVDRRSLSTVEPGDAVAGRAGYLRAGELIVDVRQAAVWTPRLPSATGPSPEALAQSHRAVLEHLPATALQRLGPMPDVLMTVGDARDAVVESALMKVIGSGPGLTPSGDDALVGMLGVLYRVCAPSEAIASVIQLRRVVPDLLWRTTPISAHYLRLGLRGAFGEHLIDLLDTIADGLEPGAAIERVLTVGATSGADALAGVALTLDMLADRAHFQCRRDVA